jgi:hypothetical protein
LPDRKFSKNLDMTRILLFGLGRWGRNHLRHLHNLPVELFVAELGDPQLEPARWMKKRMFPCRVAATIN